MPGISVGNNESIDSALRRFKKQVERGGVLSEARKREYYEKPSERKKKRAHAAKKRLLKKVRRR
jgi:small subunit ribosomal protein S21